MVLFVASSVPSNGADGEVMQIIWILSQVLDHVPGQSNAQTRSDQTKWDLAKIFLHSLHARTAWLCHEIPRSYCLPDSRRRVWFRPCNGKAPSSLVSRAMPLLKHHLDKITTIILKWKFREHMGSQTTFSALNQGQKPTEAPPR